MGTCRIHRVVPILSVARWKEKAWPTGAFVVGFPLAPGQGQAQTGLCCKEVDFEKVCPLPWEGTFAVRSVHGIFIPLIQPRQDLVHKFSRGNAFNKNLMGSGSSAESPYEFQVFLGPWLRQEPSDSLKMASLARSPRCRAYPQPPACPGWRVGSLLQKELSPRALGAQEVALVRR